LADDVDGLPHARQRGGEGLAVQTLDDLWARRAESEQEPPVGDSGQREGGHRNRDRGADADLEDSRPQQQSVGPSREEAEN
jgi:hypothetical protein